MSKDMQQNSKMEMIPDEALDEVSGGEASPYAKNLYYKVVGNSQATVKVRYYDAHGTKMGTIKVDTVVIYRKYEETVTVNGETFKLIGVTKDGDSPFNVLFIRETNLQPITPW